MSDDLEILDLRAEVQRLKRLVARLESRYDALIDAAGANGLDHNSACLHVKINDAIRCVQERRGAQP